MLREALVDDESQRKWRRSAHWRRRVVEDSAGCFVRRFSLERKPPRHQPVEENAKRPDVAADIAPFAAQNLGGHVAESARRRGAGAARLFRSVSATALEPSCQPEVQHDRTTRVVHHDVGALQVPVQNPLLVGV